MNRFQRKFANVKTLVIAALVLLALGWGAHSLFEHRQWIPELIDYAMDLSKPRDVFLAPKPIEAQPPTVDAPETVELTPTMDLKPVSVSPEKVAEEQVTTIGIVYVAGNSVLLRTGPSKAHDAVNQFGWCKPFIAFKREREWIQVGSTAPIGWMHEGFLTTDMPYRCRSIDKLFTP